MGTKNSCNVSINALSLFIIAFSIRVVAAIATTLTNVNPSSRSDATGFENAAALIARGIYQGQPYLHTANLSSTYEVWGTFIAAFWLLPGPSGLYARFGNAFLGAFAIYNVYMICRHYHSHHAGVVAAVPMMFYPSFVAIQSTLLREAIILFSITTTARLLMIQSDVVISRISQFSIVSICLGIAYIHRPENLIIYLIAIVFGLVIFSFKDDYISKRVIETGIVLSPVAVLIALPHDQQGVQFLSRTRDLRAEGRAIYFPEISPQTILEFLSFSWIGAGYFLYSPFPWMIETFPDLISSIEGIINLGFTIAAIWGIRFMWRKNSSGTIGLIAGFAVAVVFYGVATSNYAAAIRHRQMFLWVIFLFGGIGMSEYVRIKWPSVE